MAFACSKGVNKEADALDKLSVGRGSLLVLNPSLLFYGFFKQRLFSHSGMGLHCGHNRMTCFVQYTI